MSEGAVVAFIFGLVILASGIAEVSGPGVAAVVCGIIILVAVLFTSLLSYLNRRL